MNQLEMINSQLPMPRVLSALPTHAPAHSDPLREPPHTIYIYICKCNADSFSFKETMEYSTVVQLTKPQGPKLIN